MTTGWPPGLLQDDSRELGRWFASRIDARRVVRQVCAEIERERMTTEPKLPKRPEPVVHYGNSFASSEMHAYGLQCFEAGRQQGMVQERALHGLAASSREIEAGPQWVSVQDRMPPIGEEVLVYSKQSWEKKPSIKLDTWDEQHEAPLSFSSATIPIGPGWDQHDDFESVTHWAQVQPPKA